MKTNRGSFTRIGGYSALEYSEANLGRICVQGTFSNEMYQNTYLKDLEGISTNAGEWYRV